MIAILNLKCYIINSLSKIRKSKMAAILLYEKYKLSYLHPQMNSVWTEYVHCAPHTQDASFTVIFLFIGVLLGSRVEINNQDY